MYSVYLFLMRLMYWCVFRSGIDVAWSKLYRFLYEKEYKNKPLFKYRTYREIYLWIAKEIWVADGWKELWNAYSYPSYFQETGTDKKIAHDCDEFALYQATVIENAVADGTFEEQVKTYMMTVMWVSKDWKQEGHNVCLIESAEGYKWVDYSLPTKPVATIDEAVKEVIAEYAPGADVSSVAIRCTDLSTKTVKWC